LALVFTAPAPPPSYPLSLHDALPILTWTLALANSSEGAKAQLHVVASLHPWADVIAQIGGERVTVMTLLPAGASPHAFEPLPSRSEEHTSELQSRENLVCRLLLEKKK